MNRRIVIWACVLIALSIILGAIAAHALKLSPDMAERWETAAQYHMYASLGLLAVGLAEDRLRFKAASFAFLLGLGILFFSGGLYLYCFKSVVPFFSYARMIVPIGGFFMIIAWIVLAIQVFRHRKDRSETE